MKIFLTGGTGFIGSHFINHAIDAGHDLICLRRQRSQTKIKLNHQPEWLDGSLEDKWVKQLSECDMFVHLAAHSTNVPYDTLENCIYWNVIVSLKLLNQAVDAEIKNFIIAGTGFEYGISGEKYDFVPVNAPLKPTMSYPASKAASSIIFHQWAIENQVYLKYLRIFQVFGEGENENRLWPSLKKAAQAGEDFHLTSGKQIRNFVHVSEVAKQFIDNLVFSDVKSGKPVIKNIGTNKHQSIKAFAEYWWKKWGATGSLHFDKKSHRKNEVMRFVPEIE